jgi:hypothetical protein
VAARSRFTWPSVSAASSSSLVIGVKAHGSAGRGLRM